MNDIEKFLEFAKKSNKTKNPIKVQLSSDTMRHMSEVDGVLYIYIPENEIEDAINYVARQSKTNNNISNLNRIEEPIMKIDPTLANLMEKRKQNAYLSELINSFQNRNNDAREGIKEIKKREERHKKRKLNSKAIIPTKNKKYKMSDKTKQKLKRFGVGIAASILLLAAASEIDHNAKEPSIVDSPSITTTVTQTSGEEKIDSVKDVEEDFIDLYLEAYNQKYQTNYRTAELKTSNLKEGVVYKMEDGRVITRGALPDETEKVLKKYGTFKMVDGYDTVVQVISEAGVPLGTYNISTGEFLYSGNNLKDFEDPNFREPELEKLEIDKEIMRAAAEIKESVRFENEESINMRIKHYNEAKEKAKENRTEQKTKDNMEIEIAD